MTHQVSSQVKTPQQIANEIWGIDPKAEAARLKAEFDSEWPIIKWINCECGKRYPSTDMHWCESKPAHQGTWKGYEYSPQWYIDAQS